jgi:hypothetical protein
MQWLGKPCLWLGVQSGTGSLSHVTIRELLLLRRINKNLISQLLIFLVAQKRVLIAFSNEWSVHFYFLAFVLLAVFGKTATLAVIPKDFDHGE